MSMDIYLCAVLFVNVWNLLLPNIYYVFGMRLFLNLQCKYFTFVLDHTPKAKKNIVTLNCHYEIALVVDIVSDYRHISYILMSANHNNGQNLEILLWLILTNVPYLSFCVHLLSH